MGHFCDIGHKAIKPPLSWPSLLPYQTPRWAERRAAPARSASIRYPPEIRIIILRLCMPTHRTISVTWSSRDRRLSFRKSDIPAVLTVCREFRAEALKLYQPLLKHNSTTDLQFYVHTASDALRIERNTSQSPRGVGHALLDVDVCVLRVALLSPLPMDLSSVHGPGYGLLVSLAVCGGFSVLDLHDTK